jgi:hypothetical protein
MKKNRIGLLVLLISLCWLACRSREVTPAAYLSEWADYEQQIAAETTTNDLKMKLVYKPTEWLTLNDLEGMYSPSRYAEAKKGYNDHLYFTLDITNTPLSKKAAKDVQQFFIRDRQRLFTLFVGQDSLPCTLYHPEVLNDPNRQIRVNLVFPKSDDMLKDSIFKQDLRLAFNDTYSTTTQTTAFSIAAKNINQLPKIKF